MLLRWVTGMAVLVSAVVHLQLWFDGFRGIAVVGPLFLLNAFAGAAIAVAVVVWRHRLTLLAAIGFGAATLGAFLLSTTVGFFGVNERWVGVPVWVAAVSEVTAVATGVLAWVAESRPARRAGADLGPELEQRST